MARIIAYILYLGSFTQQDDFFISLNHSHAYLQLQVRYDRWSTNQDPDAEIDISVNKTA